MTKPGLARQAPAQDDLPQPPLPEAGAIAIFADLDGTLADIEATPGEVGPNAERRDLLQRLAVALDGRLAVVSGRGLDDLDRVLEGRVSALAAVHGLVRRAADGRLAEEGAPHGIAEAVRAFGQLAATDPGLLVEDKKAAAALHYRQSPAAEPACRALAERVAAEQALRVQNGDMVVEVRAPGPDKGGAVTAFMAEAPFRGALPIFIGDDFTDEDGFRAATALGGFGVVVGPRRPTLAEYALTDVRAVKAWLEALLQADR